MISVLGNSQISIPENYFRSPIDFPILLSASFGELRGGHFHSGIDIKTKGVEGKKYMLSLMDIFLVLK